MIVTITECLKTSDTFGRILSQSFKVHISRDDGTFEHDSAYSLHPGEFADDISAIIKREVDLAVQAFTILDVPPATVNEKAQYTVPAVDTKTGSSTVLRDANAVVTPAAVVHP